MRVEMASGLGGLHFAAGQRQGFENLLMTECRVKIGLFRRVGALGCVVLLRVPVLVSHSNARSPRIEKANRRPRLRTTPLWKGMTGKHFRRVSLMVRVRTVRVRNSAQASLKITYPSTLPVSSVRIA